MSEYASVSPKREKIVNLAPDEASGALFTIEDAPIIPDKTELGEHTDSPVEALERERAAYEQVLRGLGRSEERIRYLTGRQFGPRIARLAISHDVTSLLPPKPREAYVEAPPVYRDARSAAANDRLDD